MQNRLFPELLPFGVFPAAVRSASEGKNSDQTELLFSFFGNHLRIPDRIPHDLYFRFLDLRQSLDARLRVIRDRRSHSTSGRRDRKSTRLNSSHVAISYAVFCLNKKT